MEKFEQAIYGEKHKSYNVQHAKQVSGTLAGGNLVDGLRVAGQQNSAVFSLQHPQKKTVTLYRGWKPDQVDYLKLGHLGVGDKGSLKDPPLYSWSLYPSIGKTFGHGSIVTKAEVPIENLLLSDIVNATGSYDHENEVLFKGVKDLKFEVTHKS